MADKNKKKGIVESFLGEIPLFGDFFKKLAKTEAFQEKFKEVNKKIDGNISKGCKKTWGFEANLSIKPLVNKIKKETSEMYIGKDYFYGKKENRLILAIKVPKKKVDLKIKDKDLLITSDNFEKKLKLPDYYKNVKIKQYKKGILILELTK